MLLFASAAPRHLQRLWQTLAAAGYRVDVVQSGAQVWQTVMRDSAEIVIVDMSVSNADLDPWRLAAELRAATSIRIIALTRAGRNRDRARAFRLGIAQCLRLPVTVDELTAYLGLEHEPGIFTTARLPMHERPNYADEEIEIDLRNRQILRDGKFYPLGPCENLILALLIARAGRFVSTEELCESVWPGSGGREMGHRLKIHVSTLRHKIERDPKEPHYILTRRGLGYAFMPPPAREGSQPGETQPEVTGHSQTFLLTGLPTRDGVRSGGRDE